MCVCAHVYNIVLYVEACKMCSLDEINQLIKHFQLKFELITTDLVKVLHMYLFSFLGEGTGSGHD